MFPLTFVLLVDYLTKVYSHVPNAFTHTGQVLHNMFCISATYGLIFKLH
jgi:hypothetical protein